MTSVDPTSDPLPFSIEPISGEISADVELDREEEDNYRIVIEVSCLYWARALAMTVVADPGH